MHSGNKPAVLTTTTQFSEVHVYTTHALLSYYTCALSRTFQQTNLILDHIYALLEEKSNCQCLMEIACFAH